MSGTAVRKKGVVPVLCLIASAVMVLYCGQSFAQDAAHGKVASPGGYAELASTAQELGQVRIIVGVNARFTPEPTLSHTAAQEQRATISSVQGRLLAELARTGHTPKHAYSYQYVPYVAMTVDHATLDALLASPDAVSVHVDKIHFPSDLGRAATPGWDIPQIGADVLHGDGITGTGWTVAVLDTGVDKTHPYLEGSVVSEACYSTNDPAARETSLCQGGVISSTAAGSAMPYAGSCPTSLTDPNGRKCDHGTHVAGTVAGRGEATGSPGPGVAPGASIIAIQVFTRTETVANCKTAGGPPCVVVNDSDIMKGLERVYALRNTYQIASVNLSLGGNKYSANCDNDPVKGSVDNLRAAGIATIVATGNAGYRGFIEHPACISTTISVGATDDSDKVWSYSNSAHFMSLFAPGVAVTSSIPVVGSETGYASWNGTSMATPHIAGAWALMKQGRPTGSVDDILRAFTSTGLLVTDTKAPGTKKKRINVSDAYNLFMNGTVLTVAITGNQKGTVVANNLQCQGSACKGPYATGAEIALTAQPKQGSALYEWTDCDSVSGLACVMTMDVSKTVSASFGVAPGIAVAPVGLAFGQVTVETPSAKTVTFRNIGAAKSILFVGGVTVAGDDTDQFDAQHQCDDRLEKGEACRLTVTFTPTSTGHKTAHLVINTNAPGRPVVKVPLAGTGR